MDKGNLGSDYNLIVLFVMKIVSWLSFGGGGVGGWGVGVGCWGVGGGEGGQLRKDWA